MDLHTRSNITYVNPKFIAVDVHEVTTSRYFAVALATLLAYDSLLTMDKEVKFFWKRPVSTVNIVYFVNRYLGLLGAATVLSWNTFKATPNLCLFSEWTDSLANTLIILMFDYVLMIRVMALYSQDEKIGKCLKIFLVVVAGLTIGFIIYGVYMQHVKVFGLQGDLIVCGEYTILPLGWGIADWSLSAVYGAVLLVLALYQARRYWRASTGIKGLDLLIILIRDQVIYFLLIILCCVFNIMQFKLSPSNVVLAGLLESLGSPTLLCIAGSRMIVNLKEAGERGANGGTTYYMEPISTLAFAK